jgi:hypothetical protein
MTTINPLDMWNLFINELTGDPTGVLFMGFSLIMILVFCAKIRMPNDATLIIMIIYGLIMSAFFSAVLVLSILAVVFFLSFMFSKFIGRL